MEENCSTGSCILLRCRHNALWTRSTVVVLVSGLLGIRGMPRKRTNFQKRIVGNAMREGEQARQGYCHIRSTTFIMISTSFGTWHSSSTSRYSSSLSGLKCGIGFTVLSFISMSGLETLFIDSFHRGRGLRQ